jgi:hypothetical protein
VSARNNYHRPTNRLPIMKTYLLAHMATCPILIY